MARIWWWAGAGALAALALAVRLPVQAAEEPDDPPPRDALLLVLRSDGESPLVLEKARLRRFGGKRFLVGIGLKIGKSKEWSADRTIWTDFDQVSQMIEAPDLEQATKTAAGLAAERQAQRAGRDPDL